MAADMLSTQGLWREAEIQGIRPAQDSLSLYLNLLDATGTAWFDDVQLLAEGDG